MPCGSPSHLLLRVGGQHLSPGRGFHLIRPHPPGIVSDLIKDPTDLGSQVYLQNAFNRTEPNMGATSLSGQSPLHTRGREMPQGVEDTGGRGSRGPS